MYSKTSTREWSDRPHEGNAIADLQRAYLMSNGGAVMKRDEALTALRGQRSLLETRFGVTRLGIFGSVSRDEATDYSDLDVVVEMAPDLFRMVRLKEHLQETLRVPVDIVRYRNNMNPFLKQRIDREAFYV